MLSLKQAIDQLNAKHPRSAIGAFNFNDMTDMQGVMRAAMHTRQPCIMMASAGAVSYMGIHFVREMYRAANMTSTVPLYLMLDHSDSVETCAECIDNGFSLVMYDGSALPFDENVRRTREVVRVAHARGVLVEAEIGRLPGPRRAPGREGDGRPCHRSAGGEGVLGTGGGGPACNFIRNRAWILQVRAPAEPRRGPGNPQAHRRPPRNARGHGCPRRRRARSHCRGVKKVNIGTELKHAFTSSMRGTLAQLEKEIDPRKILGPARDAVQKAVEGRLAVLCTPRVEELI